MSGFKRVNIFWKRRPRKDNHKFVLERRKRKINKDKLVSSDSKVFQNKTIGDIFFNQDEVNHETQESEGGEADLHKHLMECTKNPGHLNFIPVDTFSLKHLPKDYQDNDLHDYIKVTAVLTVRVDVKLTSPNRPEFWPGTKSPYPFHNLRGKSTLKTGTGVVSWVERCAEKFTDGRKDYIRGKCKCTECNISDHPSSVWWEFYVFTAAHVVFDNIEASHTSLRLFYDRDDRIVDIHNKVSVSEILSININDDLCRLRCVTCNENIGEKLYMSWRHYDDVWWKVRVKYNISRNIHRMTFIVSHPHGCCKQVSLGQWKDMYEVNEVTKRCTYTTCTCPGSSGAHVFCVGFHYGSWLFHNIVHSGSLRSGLNYSGVGFFL